MKRVFGQAPPKDSSNSSIPPSKENLKSEVIGRTGSLRQQSGRSVGGQKGHKGHKLEMARTVDEVVEHVSCFCIHCGEDLSQLEASLKAGGFFI